MAMAMAMTRIINLNLLCKKKLGQKHAFHFKKIQHSKVVVFAVPKPFVGFLSFTYKLDA